MTNLVQEMEDEFDLCYDPKGYSDIILKYHKKGLDTQQLLIAMTGELFNLTYGLDSPSDCFNTVPRKINVLLEHINNLWKLGKLPETKKE